MILRNPIALICTFTWVGFVCAISFLEAWLKFRAPGVTLPIGLGIGRLVFGALNKVELVLAAVIAIDLLRTRLAKSALPLGKGPAMAPWLWIGLPAALLLVQTFWLLPTLDARAEAVIQNGPAPPSQLHFVYVAFEVVKVVALVVFGTRLFGRVATTTAI
ncbi:MAG: hypothetical protein KF797_06320 [Flavobacteriales bacterium]|nr:hypothetical protein [Flavobacteriales bacterium]